MTKAVFIIGNSGSGKTEMANLQSSFLNRDGFSSFLISDRIWLEEAVIADVGYRGQHIGPEGLVGIHSKMIADGPPGHRKVHVLDGFLLNRVHEQMIAYVRENRINKEIVVAEYATGPDIRFGDKLEPLMQSGQDLLERIRRHQVNDNIFLIGVDSPLSVRSARNAARSDGLDAETFALYFRDGGDLPKDIAQKYGVSFHLLDNGYHDPKRFFREAQQIYYERVYQLVKQEGRQPGITR